VACLRIASIYATREQWIFPPDGDSAKSRMRLVETDNLFSISATETDHDTVAFVKTRKGVPR
jgi:hypothetical protein